MSMSTEPEIDNNQSPNGDDQQQPTDDNINPTITNDHNYLTNNNIENPIDTNPVDNNQSIEEDDDDPYTDVSSISEEGGTEKLQRNFSNLSEKDEMLLRQSFSMGSANNNSQVNINDVINKEGVNIVEITNNEDNDVSMLGDSLPLQSSSSKSTTADNNNNITALQLQSSSSNTTSKSNTDQSTKCYDRPPRVRTSSNGSNVTSNPGSANNSPKQRSPKPPLLSCVTSDSNGVGGGQFPSSPLGSVSVNMMKDTSDRAGSSINSKTTTSPPAAMPRFYDSDTEEGAGSLVFIERNASTTSSINNLSPKTNNVNMFLRQSPSADLSDTGSFVQTPEKPINRKDTNILPIRGNNRNRMMGPEIDEQSPQLLPYQHRKKLSQKEELMTTPDVVQQNNLIEQLPPPMDQSPGVGESSKRPPLPVPPPPNTVASPITAALLADRGVAVAADLPPPPMPMHTNTMSSPSASKYKVAVIPPFRGGGLEGQSHERTSSVEDESIEQQQRQGGSGGKMKKMRKVKSAQSSSSSSRKNRKNKRGNNSNNNNPNQSSKATPDNNGDKFRPPRHEVIDPTPPPPLPQSPRQGGYHVRVSSQSSISSLESKAATDAEGQQQQQQQRIPHPNTSEYWYYQQKQLQQQYNARQQSQQQQKQQARGNFNVNFNAVLGPEVASFLHGEEIASAVERRQQGVMPHPNSQQYGGPPPPQQQQQQWNDPRQQYGGGHQRQWGQRQQPGVYGQSLEGHLIPNSHVPPPLQQPHGYPGYHLEPQAPPLTYQHPNMHFDKRQHRERLPSVSEDDFDEMLDDGKQNREGNNRNRQQQQQWNQQQQYSRQYNNPQQQQWNQQQYPPRQQQGHERKHSRKGSRRQRSRGGGNGGGGGFLGDDLPPNEKSSLLSATGIQTYESRDGRGGGGDRDYNVNNNPGVWGGQQQRHPQAYNTPREQQTNASRGGGGATNSSKKKKSKRRRREKEKRRFAYPSDSSDEETSGNRRSTTKSKRRGGGGGRRSQRKKRSQAASGGTPSIDHSSMSETYSESLMSTSYADRSERVRAKGPLQQLLISSKLLICNLPLSSAAISLSIVLLGIVWLKWTEEILPSCKEVNFHSSQCTYPEFPGCYFCDEYNPYYRLATQFHTVCSLTAGISVLLFFAKAILCWRVFMDEMSSPTTASPSGLIFMTMALGFVGKDWGDLGMILIFIASLLHLVLVVWFIYMSLAYQTMPDPSWFANTIGIGLCAVKIWFYYPLSGHFLIAIALMLTFLYYPISLIRVAFNEKMSATICWINMMGPAISLYSLAIIMEPTFQQERPDISHFQTVQRSIYLPSMTCLFGLCLIGMLSSVHGLIVRWKQISREEFSPAHAAYSFPLLMHALAVQSYRSSLDFFQPADEVNPTLKTALHAYWVFLVVTGTFVAITCIIMYLVFLPTWVDVDTRDELEPPAPNETSICASVTYGESLIQPYISPTILQANETGTLIMSYDYQNNWFDLVRTRRIPAFGFEPMMGKRMFNRERNALKLFMGGVIQEGDEEGEERSEDVMFGNELAENALGRV